MEDDLIKRLSKLPQHIVYGGVILIVGLVLVGTYGYFRHQDIENKKKQYIIDLQKERVEREREDNTRASLEKCLGDANAAYQNNWNSEAKRLGYEKENTLPEYYANVVNKYFEDAKDECFKKHPQK